MNFAFFGTDEFSVKTLNTLKERGFLPNLIVTTPDKPQGRKMVLTPPPVKVWAIENKIDFVQPIKLKDFEFPAGDWDVFIVASYGKIIPQTILDIPKAGTLNIHPSLLPKYRGATPLESAILSDDIETGVTIIILDAEMDHGPIVAQTKTLLDNKYYEELRDELAETGGNLVANILPDFVAGKITPIEQDHTQATFTKKIIKEDGLINLADDLIINFRKIRAFTPWPSAYFFDTRNGKNIRTIIKKAHLEGGALKIDRVTPEGKTEMDWKN